MNILNYNKYGDDKMKKILFTLVISFSIILPVNAEKNYPYKIEYYYDGILDVNETIIKEAPYSNMIKSFELKPRDTYILDHSTIDNEGLVITDKENIIKVYYTSENTKPVFDIINETNQKNNILNNVKNILIQMLKFIQKLIK